MNTKEILVKAKALIEDKHNWTTERLARSVLGHAEEVDSPKACKFCAVGAVLRTDSDEEGANAWDRLDEAADELYKESVTVVNDHRGHAAIMKVYDLAIAKENP